jgi:hypothetical protein
MKSTTKLVTFVLIPVAVLAFIAYDVYAILVGGTEASISSLIISSAYKMPFMVYCLGLINGILVGHLFWRMKGNKDTDEIDSGKF